jgi:hypothetical protein
VVEMLHKKEEIEKQHFRKEELRKRDYFFHPQLNTNPMMERDLGAGNRNNILIEGVFSS